MQEEGYRGTDWTGLSGPVPHLVITMGLIEPVNDTDPNLHLRLNRDYYLLHLTQASEFKNNKGFRLQKQFLFCKLPRKPEQPK